MNPIVEKWIAEQEQLRKKKREEHLIALGLIDKTKSNLKTVYKSAAGIVLDEDGVELVKKRGGQVIETTTGSIEVIDVTDEEYDLICKYAPEPQEKATTSSGRNEIELLKSIANSTSIISKILIAYVILSIIAGIIIAS